MYGSMMGGGSISEDSEEDYEKREVRRSIGD